MEGKRVLAMYDVRGIQKYIFRTSKLKDAVGASAIVEDIIEEALKAAVDKVKQEESITSDLQWVADGKVCEYQDNKYDVQVLYIGGGNAFVEFSTGRLCKRINQLMAKYVLDNTYSLQLAVAYVEKKTSYKEDYQKLTNEMSRVKVDMKVSKPLGALPVMDIEIKTGYPLIDSENSMESYLKKNKDETVRESVCKAEKIIDNYGTKKGIDSNIAVVHIDGNNMGVRIRELVDGIEDYKTAVDTMRKISHRINNSFKEVFDDMKKKIDIEGRELVKDKEKDNFVMKVLVAGDDITYICNAKIALKTVKYYCDQISNHTLYGDNTEENVKKYGFSVCAGIAYMGSHFPFYAGYEVAESCCESAKDVAKDDVNKADGRIGNFVDFQICKNVHAKNLKEMRKREYVTASGEELLMRPYFIKTAGKESEGFNIAKEKTLEEFLNAVKYFADGKNIPSSFAKKLRNTYSLGQNQMEIVNSFLESRSWKMPDNKNELYYIINSKKVAKWYDALEMMDFYIEEM